MLATRKREHSRKPDELYDIIEACSPGPYLELFARYPRDGWYAWGDEASEEVAPRGRRHRCYQGASTGRAPAAAMIPANSSITLTTLSPISISRELAPQSVPVI